WPMPDGRLALICPGDSYHQGKAEIVMSMKADTAHLFWMGKINLMAALAKGQIVSKGPINKALALLPAIKPTYTMYPEHLKKLGMEELIV
ncbi:MAG TPA: hypothetical protein VFF14_07390, partial [Candidatus Deferrimicrobium sp.]|nr:hypothetical protein [Candidatus Deferrimicrobium sp.]